MLELFLTICRLGCCGGPHQHPRSSAVQRGSALARSEAEPPPTRPLMHGLEKCHCYGPLHPWKGSSLEHGLPDSEPPWQAWLSGSALEPCPATLPVALNAKRIILIPQPHCHVLEAILAHASRISPQNRRRSLNICERAFPSTCVTPAATRLRLGLRPGVLVWHCPVLACDCQVARAANAADSPRQEYPATFET